MEDSHVDGDLGHHPRSLHLDRHLPACRELRAIHLPKARSGHWDGIEARKERVRAGAQLFCDDRPCVIDRKGRDSILEARQRLEILDREEVMPCRQHLADLDEGGPEGHEDIAKTLAFSLEPYRGGHRPSTEPAAVGEPDPRREERE
jgi:hypothetical protein